MKTTHPTHVTRSSDHGREPWTGASLRWGRLGPAGSLVRRSFLAAAAALGLNGVAAAANLDFEQDSYTASLGQPVELRVLIDYESHVPQSLFSYGVRLTSTAEAGMTVTNIDVPPELDHNFSTGTAAVDLSPDEWSVKGHVALGSPPSYYTGALIATFTAQFSQPGTYTIGLALHRTAGSSESIFIDGDGGVLDDELTPLGTATVIVGEPEIPVLTLRRVAVPPGTIEIEFQSANLITYTLRTSLNLTVWTDVTTIVGDGTVVTYQHLGAGFDSKRFYQVAAEFGGGP